MGTPKALLRYGDESFLDTLIGLFQPRCAPVIVVLGAAAQQVRTATKRAATFVENESWQRGQTSSMQCGLRAVPAAAEGVLFTLVDHPAVTIKTIDALLDASAPLLRVPRYQGHNGHPSWFSRRLITEFLTLDDSGTARDVVRAHASETEFVDVDDPGVLADIDDPAAYRALIEAGR
jgi:CTP:molybdopterin cytidylyltransferase MocA